MRFFGGAELDASMLDAADGIDQAYERGVTMGSDIELSTDDARAPNFLVMASADPSSAPLQRLQVIKGWVDAEGEKHEEVIDVACAGGAAVNPRRIVALTTVLGWISLPVQLTQRPARLSSLRFGRILSLILRFAPFITRV